MGKTRSADEKSAIRKAAGMMSAVWLLLEAAVRERGGDDDSIAQLNTAKGQHLIGPIADLLVGKVAAPMVQVAWSVCLAWIIAACKFVSYVHPDITAEHFPPQPGDLIIKEVIDVAIPRSMSTPEVLKFLDEKSLRPATLVELLWWWITNPQKQSNCLVVALGSVWHGSVPYVYGSGDGRGLGLYSVGLDWDTYCAFAAVSKSAAKAAA